MLSSKGRGILPPNVTLPKQKRSAPHTQRESTEIDRIEVICGGCSDLTHVRVRAGGKATDKGREARDAGSLYKLNGWCENGRGPDCPIM